jgi:hypothetical protein
MPSDVDTDLLIARLAGSLSPTARHAFRQAAEAALAHVPCQGEGIIYRTLASVWRVYFDPPSDGRAAWDIGQEARASKLRAAPPLAYGGDQRRVRYRRQFKAVD